MEQKQHSSEETNRALYEAFSRIGRTEGRLDALETKFTEWEERLDARLAKIEGELSSISKRLTQGEGVWGLLKLVGWLVVALPSFILLANLILK